MDELRRRGPHPTDGLGLVLLVHHGSLDRLEADLDRDQRLELATPAVPGVDHVVVEVDVEPAQPAGLAAGGRPLDELRLQRLALAMKIPPGPGEPLGRPRLPHRADREKHAQ